MGKPLIQLGAEHESPLCVFGQAEDGAFVGGLVEGGVEFNCIEDRGILLEHALVRIIEGTQPFLVGPTRAAEVHGLIL